MKNIIINPNVVSSLSESALGVVIIVAVSMHKAPEAIGLGSFYKQQG